jgi:hypothetical protein
VSSRRLIAADDDSVATGKLGVPGRYLPGEPVVRWLVR